MGECANYEAKRPQPIGAAWGGCGVYTPSAGGLLKQDFIISEWDGKSNALSFNRIALQVGIMFTNPSQIYSVARRRVFFLVGRRYSDRVGLTIPLLQYGYSDLHLLYYRAG